MLPVDTFDFYFVYTISYTDWCYCLKWWHMAVKLLIQTKRLAPCCLGGLLVHATYIPKPLDTCKYLVYLLIHARKDKFLIRNQSNVFALNSRSCFNLQLLLSFTYHFTSKLTPVFRFICWLVSNYCSVTCNNSQTTKQMANNG